MWHDSNCQCSGCEDAYVEEQRQEWLTSYTGILVAAVETEDTDEMRDALEYLDMDGEQLADAVEDALGYLGPNEGAVLREVAGC